MHSPKQHITRNFKREMQVLVLGIAGVAVSGWMVAALMASIDSDAYESNDITTDALPVKGELPALSLE